MRCLFVHLFVHNVLFNRHLFLHGSISTAGVAVTLFFLKITWFYFCIFCCKSHMEQRGRVSPLWIQGKLPFTIRDWRNKIKIKIQIKIKIRQRRKSGQAAEQLLQLEYLRDSSASFLNILPLLSLGLMHSRFLNGMSSQERRYARLRHVLLPAAWHPRAPVMSRGNLVVRSFLPLQQPTLTRFPR